MQVASEQQLSAFQARVSAIRAAKTLPPNVKWTTTTAASTCHIFKGNTTFYVLYAGPFASADQGCAARLAAPPDAFIRIDSIGVDSFYSCVCPALPEALPDISTIGQTGVWVGELRRILLREDYSVNEPTDGSYGVYTSDLADGVAVFQDRAGLTPTGMVDPTTWSALANSVCAG